MTQNCCQPPADSKPPTAEDVADDIRTAKIFTVMFLLAFIAYNVWIYIATDGQMPPQYKAPYWAVFLPSAIFLVPGLMGIYGAFIHGRHDVAKAEAADQAREQKRIARASGI